MNIKRVLQKMVEIKASDLHVKVGTSHRATERSLVTLDEPAPGQADLEAIVDQILTRSRRRPRGHKRGGLRFRRDGLSRFRSNFYQQRGTIAMVFRQVPATIPSFEELNLPEPSRRSPPARGLVLVCGTVGSGKSTTLAP